MLALKIKTLKAQVVRIIGTVPVYSTSAFLCLRFPHRAVYIHGIREIYEAYVIYCFLQYLIFFLGGCEYCCSSLFLHSIDLKLIVLFLSTSISPPNSCLFSRLLASYLR